MAKFRLFNTKLFDPVCIALKLRLFETVGWISPLPGIVHDVCFVKWLQILKKIKSINNSKIKIFNHKKIQSKVSLIFLIIKYYFLVLFNFFLNLEKTIQNNFFKTEFFDSKKNIFNIF